MQLSRAAGYIFGVSVIAAVAAAVWLPHVRTWPPSAPHQPLGGVPQSAADVVAPNLPSARMKGPFPAADSASTSSVAAGSALVGDLSPQLASQWWSVVADIAAMESAAVFTAFCASRDAAWLAIAEQRIGAEGLKRLEELHPVGINSLPDFVAGIIAGARGLSGAGWELSQPHSWRHCAPAAAPSVRTFDRHN